MRGDSEIDQFVGADEETVALPDALLDLDAEEGRGDDTDEREDHAEMDDVAAIAPVVLGNQIDHAPWRRARRPYGGAR